ncbi:MAG: YkgJ family cysteine cluster protein [Desulfobulbaceae bacterium]|nr:YkgJ family cysteine cluster protein [Desulfobulbaceae bacterium]MCK5404306.1 YkgJ family cysteine cluster protein [Desulfobulbaceae bacterium]
MNLNLPDNVRKLASGEAFQFSCNPAVSCFTECCRELDLALSPYDVLRLRKGLGLSSGEFMDKYAIVEQGEDDFFPHVYLTMIDDGRASCPFVTPEGCRIYKDRPGACRIYPLGRAAYQDDSGKQQDLHVVITEPHCNGFNGNRKFTVPEWIEDQDLAAYNRSNDEMMPVLQHERFKSGEKLNKDQAAVFLLALYDLDRFRETILTEEYNSPVPMTAEEQEKMKTDDESLLCYAVRWLQHEIFNKTVQTVQTIQSIQSRA